jgi:hypothetical protein
VQLLRVSDVSPRPYQRHELEKTVLYRIVAEHLETFLAEAREQHDKGLPKYVEKELRESLDCGILSRGYVLGVCSSCGRQLRAAVVQEARVPAQGVGTAALTETAAVRRGDTAIDAVVPTRNRTGSQ